MGKDCAFLRKKSEAYLNLGELSLKSKSMKDEEWRQLQSELTKWLLDRSNEEIEVKWKGLVG